MTSDQPSPDSRFRERLAPDEQIIWSGGPDRTYVRKQFRKAALIGCGVIVLIALPFIFLPTTGWFLLPLGILLLTGEIWFGLAFDQLAKAGIGFSQRESAYLLTNKRLLLSEYSGQSREIAFDQIKWTTATQGTIGDVNVLVKSGYFRRTYTLHAIDNPVQVRNLINEARL